MVGTFFYKKIKKFRGNVIFENIYISEEVNITKEKITKRGMKEWKL